MCSSTSLCHSSGDNGGVSDVKIQLKARVDGGGLSNLPSGHTGQQVLLLQGVGNRCPEYRSNCQSGSESPPHGVFSCLIDINLTLQGSSW